MPTDREREILELIRQNPMITQKELAKTLGITRPGVASHISKLIKEGYIRGKGYVFPKKEHVTVIGAVNMDVYGVLDEEKVIPKGSNSGHIAMQLGGMARNIAANLSMMDVNTNLITVYGNDKNGIIFKKDALKRQINISYSKQFLDYSTSMYIYINKSNGNRVIGVDDMKINSQITPEFLERRLPEINNSKAVVFDSNIPVETINWIYENITPPKIAKAVSVDKSYRLLQDNVNLDALIINGIEGSLISNVKINDVNDAKQCAAVLYKQFNTDIYLYVDDMGLIFLSKNHHKINFYSSNIKVINTNGVGASMAAMVTYSKVRNLSVSETLRLVIEAGELTMESNKSVNNNITKLAKKFNY